MAKLIGYIIALIGLIVLGLSFFTKKISFIAPIDPKFFMIGGVIIIIIGIALSLGEGKTKVHQSSVEVPIYEGTGKNRKIVGYRRESKK